MRYLVLLCLVLVTGAQRNDERCAEHVTHDPAYECSGEDLVVKTADICSETLQCGGGERIKVLSNDDMEQVDRLKCKCDGLRECALPGIGMCGRKVRKERPVKYTCRPGALNCCEAGEGAQYNEACGFRLTCQCCGNSSLTFGQCPVNEGGDLFLGQNNEEYTSGIVSSAVSYSFRSTQEATDDQPDIDEDGCHLRVAEYQGKLLCVPGNMAQTLKRIARTMKAQDLGTCSAVFEPNCTVPLNTEERYKYKVMVSPKEEGSLSALLKVVKRWCTPQGSDELIMICDV